MKKILILRAGFLQQFLCKRAKELGMKVYAVDADPQSEGFIYADETATFRVADEENCLLYAQEKQPDGVVTAANDYGILSMSRIAKDLHLNGVDYKSATTIKNKAKVRKVLFEEHVDDTDCFYEINNSAQVESFWDSLSYPVMVKPCDGSGSRGVSRVDGKDSLKDACIKAIAESDTHAALIEQYIQGAEYGVESFVDDEIHILAVMQKDMTLPPFYAELGHASESGLPLSIEEKVKACVMRAIRALGINFGCVNMDLIVTPSGSVHIIDVGARMGGNVIGSHLIPMGKGIDYLGNILKASTGETVSWKPTMPHKPTATRLIVLTPGVIASIPDIIAIEKDYDVKIVHHLEVGAFINEYHANRDGFGYIIAQGDSIDEAKEKAKTALRALDKQIQRESSDLEYNILMGGDKIKIVFQILSACGHDMYNNRGLEHWLPDYPIEAIEKDVKDKFVILVYDTLSGEYISTFQMYLESDDSLYIRKVATLPEWQGRGIGKKNMLFVNDFARKLHCKKVCLDVYDKSQESIDFYLHNGFKVTGKTKTRRFEVLLMERCLAEE
jgi:biotin carboxylase/N-acetylglutamate synthase-like GNAT family acetyltransferase